MNPATKKIIRQRVKSQPGPFIERDNISLPVRADGANSITRYEAARMTPGHCETLSKRVSRGVSGRGN